MRYLLLTFCLLISFFSLAQETMNYPKYTLGEVYDMIAKEETDTFTLKNANIVLDTIADRNYLLKVIDLETFDPVRTDSIEIHKSIVFENVFTQENQSEDKYLVGFNKVNFHKSVLIKNSRLWMTHSHFKNQVTVRFNDDLTKSLTENFGPDSYAWLMFDQNIFEFDPRVSSASLTDEPLIAGFWLTSSILKGTNEVKDINWFLRGFLTFEIENNTFLNRHANYIAVAKNRGRIVNNDFGDRSVQVFITDEGIKNLEFRENSMNDVFMLRLTESIQNLQMDWNQFSSGIIGMGLYGDFVQELSKANTTDDYDISFRSEEYLNKWLDSARVVNNRYYKSEIALLGTLNSIYKRQHDLESANGSYIALKDLETKRLRFLYYQNPSFDAFFKWKINQFLKIFSAYGTEPAKAITMSVYVVLVFALIYLFFPNYWDSHGKDRIQHRFRFFYKYLSRDAGIENVYLEENKDEIDKNAAFKTLLIEHKPQAPGMFFKLAMPLYRWSMAGTMTAAWLVKRFDFLKGTWQGTDPKSRGIKGFLVSLIFIVALLYDIFIKILNALMLSINTFTTLGFGEIPIKGLPRYLAIIQSFIGWFMLTIFSVSLISQLLN